MIHHWSTCRR